MSSQFHVPQSKADADPRRWVALAVLLLASFMNLIDVTIVNVALPSLQQNLGADPTQIEWVIAAYVLAFALGLLPFGRLGDGAVQHAVHAGGLGPGGGDSERIGSDRPPHAAADARSHFSP